MRKLIFLLSLSISILAQAQNASYNMVQISNWDNDSLNHIGTQTFSSCWGWADTSNGREYAILGSTDSTYFIDITVPETPVVCDVHAGKARNTIWREYKSYGKYVYAVSDAGGSSLQIFDMSYLPDSAYKVYDSDSLFSKSHTIWVDNHRLYCNSVLDGNNKLHATSAYSLVNPESPEFIGDIQPPVFGGVPAFNKCHDAYVRGDTLWCSGETNGLFIYDVRDMANPVLMGVITDYPEKGYNHSGAVSGDGKTFVFTDENSGLGIKAYDITNFSDFTLKKVFRSHAGAIAHNPYFIGNRLFMSYYHDGVYVFNMDDASNPVVIGYFDTYPQNGDNYGGFEGCWQVYPDLPSGNIIAGDMTNGLFVLRLSATAGIENLVGTQDVFIYPNPNKGQVNLEYDASQDEELSLEILDLKGAKVYEQKLFSEAGRNKHSLNLEANIQTGVYVLQLTGQNTHICKKLVIR